MFSKGVLNTRPIRWQLIPLRASHYLLGHYYILGCCMIWCMCMWEVLFAFVCSQSNESFIKDTSERWRGHHVKRNVDAKHFSRQMFSSVSAWPHNWSIDISFSSGLEEEQRGSVWLKGHRFKSLNQLMSRPSSLAAPNNNLSKTQPATHWLREIMTPVMQCIYQRETHHVRTKSGCSRVQESQYCALIFSEKELFTFYYYTEERNKKEAASLWQSVIYESPSLSSFSWTKRNSLSS